MGLLGTSEERDMLENLAILAGFIAVVRSRSLPHGASTAPTRIGLTHYLPLDGSHWLSEGGALFRCVYQTQIPMSDCARRATIHINMVHHL